MRWIIGCLVLAFALSLPACAGDDDDFTWPPRLVHIPGWDDATLAFHLDRPYEFVVDDIDLVVDDFDTEDFYVDATIRNSGRHAGELRVQTRITHLTVRGQRIRSDEKMLIAHPTGVDENGHQLYEHVPIWNDTFAQGSTRVRIDVFADATQEYEWDHAFLAGLGDYLEPNEGNNGRFQLWTWVETAGEVDRVWHRGEVGEWDQGRGGVIDRHGHLPSVE